MPRQPQEPRRRRLLPSVHPATLYQASLIDQSCLTDQGMASAHHGPFRIILIVRTVRGAAAGTGSDSRGVLAEPPHRAVSEDRQLCDDVEAAVRSPVCRMRRGRYIMAMKPVLRRMDAATYVKDIEASRAFYELLGFAELRSDRGPASAWSAMRNGRDTVLLTATWPPLPVPRFPLLFYFFFEDLDALLNGLGDAGLKPVRLGHPPHAPGGEAKVTDPDGNTILLGQEARSPGQPPGQEEDEQDWFSILKEAAALAQAPGRHDSSLRDQPNREVMLAAG